MDGSAVAAELHLVHKKDGYTMEEALAKPDGFAVLGIFIKVPCPCSKVIRSRGVADRKWGRRTRAGPTSTRTWPS